uniref:2-Hacid_dh_C domain-containing protein n=1 Tax=Macrostomum lignano TaxID=282301 RepID=A0A1I8F611_9PLAT
LKNVRPIHERRVRHGPPASGGSAGRSRLLRRRTVPSATLTLLARFHEKVLNEAVGALMWHTIQLSREDLAKFKSLRVIVRVGRGLTTLTSRPRRDGRRRLQHTTLCLILNLYRRTFWLANMLRDGKKAAAPCPRIRVTPRHRRVWTRIGTAVALRAQAFGGFRVTFYDPYLPDGIEKSRGRGSEFTLCRTCCSKAHSWSTTGRAAPGSTSTSVAKALKEERIRAAAFDVFEHEPFSLSASPLKDCQNALFTPHSAFYSDASYPGAAGARGRRDAPRHHRQNSEAAARGNCVNARSSSSGAWQPRTFRCRGFGRRAL